MANQPNSAVPQILENATTVDSTVNPTATPVVEPLLNLTKKPPLPPKIKERSDVWEHYTKYTAENGELKCTCRYCPKTYNAESNKYGTSTLRKHMNKCIHNPMNADTTQPEIVMKSRDGEFATLQTWKFDADLSRRKLVAMIVLDEFPFRFVEAKGFIDFVENLQPKFKIPSRYTISRDIDKLYLSERKNLQEFFKTSGVCVSLTTDTWTSNQRLNYMCITAHYIDKDWKLHKNIITFCVVDSHKGDDLGKLIDGCLRDWGIQRVYAITVDNAAANKTCLTYLKGRFKSRGIGVLGGEYLHVRCTAHILNLIVGEGLKVLDDSVARVREAVRYARQSPPRFARFKECCAEDGITTKAFLCLDVATRWNSTYFMLSSAQKFQKAFDLFLLSDPTFLRDSKEGPPTDADWDAVRDVMELLVEFYEVTLRVSGSSYVTAHTVFHEIDTIGKLLKSEVHNLNAQIRSMCLAMQPKFDKYWGSFKNMSMLYWVGLVVDPRYKLRFIDFYLRKEYGDYEGPKFVMDVKMALDDLYEHYQALHQEKPNAPSMIPFMTQDVASSSSSSHATKKAKYSTADDWMKEVSGDVQQLKNDLEIYLSEDVLIIEKKKEFDILKWWDVQQCRLPILSHLARDVLAFPISTVPSECAFSTSGRVLDAFRSSLSPRLVEALLCVQDWLKNTPYEIVVEEDLASIIQHEEGLDENKTTTSGSTHVAP